MKLYEFNIRMIKQGFDSQRNFRDITIATFPLTLENNALSGWDGKIIAPHVDSGNWSAPEIALYFWKCSNGSWKRSSPNKTVWLSDEDPLSFKNFATGRVFMDGLSLFPPVIGMEGDGFVLSAKPRQEMSYEERKREVDLFKWKLTYRGF